MIVLPAIDQTRRRVVPAFCENKPLSDLHQVHPFEDDMVSVDSGGIENDRCPSISSIEGTTVWINSIPRCISGETVSSCYLPDLVPKNLDIKTTRALPPTVTKPVKILKHFQTPKKIGRIRIKSVDLGDIRYFANTLDQKIVSHEIKEDEPILNKLKEVRYNGKRDRDLIINFFRLFLLSETIQDLWIIEKSYRDIAIKLIEDFIAIRLVLSINDPCLGISILNLCKKYTDDIYKISSSGLLAIKCW